MQPPSQDPTNPTGQPFKSSPEEPLSHPLNPTGQLYPSSSYAQTEPPFTPPINYPAGEENYYKQLAQDEEPITQYQDQKKNKLSDAGKTKSGAGWKVATIALLILVLILATATTTLLLTRPKSSTPNPTANVAQATQKPTVTSTTTGATATVVSSTTPTTTGATATAPVSTAAALASGTVTENLLLTCGANCNDPIRMTITTIQVDNTNGNMIWNISMKNVSGSSINYYMNTFELLANGTQTQIPATFSQSNGTLSNSDPVSIQGTFSFVPLQNTTYTLSTVIDASGNFITFDPVQITNL